MTIPKTKKNENFSVFFAFDRKNLLFPPISFQQFFDFLPPDDQIVETSGVLHQRFPVDVYSQKISLVVGKIPVRGGAFAVFRQPDAVA